MANEFIDLANKLNSIVRSERNLRIALTSTLALQKQRIFARGLDSNESKIGTYSTKPTSISKKQQARNTGKTQFKAGYAEYKRLVGKNPGYVILRNTDQMMMDYGLQGGGLTYGFGFQNSKNFDKSQWMEDKYKTPIFDLAVNEEEVLVDVLEDQLRKGLQ